MNKLKIYNTISNLPYVINQHTYKTDVFLHWVAIVSNSNFWTRGFITYNDMVIYVGRD